MRPFEANQLGFADGVCVFVCVCVLSEPEEESLDTHTHTQTCCCFEKRTAIHRVKVIYMKSNPMRSVSKATNAWRTERD